MLIRVLLNNTSILLGEFDPLKEFAASVVEVPIDEMGKFELIWVDSSFNIFEMFCWFFIKLSFEILAKFCWSRFKSRQLSLVFDVVSVSAD